MRVIKRSGEEQEVDFNKITTRLKKLITEFKLENVDPIKIAKKVCDSIYDRVTTVKLDNLSAELSITYATIHPDYGNLASYIEVSNLHKNNIKTFYEKTKLLYEDGLLNDDYMKCVTENMEKINDNIDYKKDYELDYFGIKTLQKAYLFKHDGNVLENPQDMWMRVAIGIHMDDIDMAIETYKYMATKIFTHATPTLFNAGTKWPQLSSCYLLELNDDSINGIYDSLSECAQISKWAGGIGLHIHKLRATGADIRMNKKVGSGIVPALRVFNATSRYVNQGGKRPGSIAIYLSIDHADVLKFFDLKKNTGDEEERCRDLFYGIWISDLFMRRVKNNQKWSLFCPSKTKDLTDLYGEEYDRLYEYYESKGLYTQQIDAKTIWFKLCNAQIETGTPYILYKDHINKKSNQKNVGTIKSSNLCVAPDTQVLTDEGYKEIGKYENEYLNIWNGSMFSKVLIKKTKAITQIMRIHFNTKTYIDCSYGHNFYIKCGDVNVRIPANELIAGQELMYFRLPDGELVRPVIVKIEKEYGFTPTYCFTEEMQNKAVFNGVLTGQCTEIMEYTSPNEIAVCNLASIALPMFVNNKTFDYAFLHKITRVITRNLNKVIDINYYPLEKAKYSNLRHRPIGIGVQGLADVYMLLKHPFESEEASEVNKKIFETIYHAALTESMELSKIYGPYETFEGSPASQGLLQFDLWNTYDTIGDVCDTTNSIYDWNKLKEDIKKNGLRNSLLVAPMPTASTSQILGNNECIEPYTSNIYLRRTLAGEFVVINKHLINDLINIGIWSEKIKDDIIFNNGSIQNIYSIPEDLKKLYKTAWEIKQKTLINQAADRGKYICQSQSLNLFVPSPDLKKLSSIHFYSWDKGLKTGMYYLRTQPAANPIQFTINPEICTTCSS